MSAFSGITSIAAILIGEDGVSLFAIAGIGIAPIYPTAMALVANRYRKTKGTAITFVVTCVGVGAIIGNLLIGYIIEWVNAIVYGPGNNSITIGMQAGYGFIAFSAILCAVFGFILHERLKVKERRGYK